MIVPQTRVCHALTRVDFYMKISRTRNRLPVIFALLALLIALPAFSALAGEENARDVDRLNPSGPSINDRYVPGDPDEMVFFDFEGPVLYNPAQDVKDHTIIIVDGVYHIF